MFPILGKERFTPRPNKSKWGSAAADQQDAAVCWHLEEGLQLGPVNLLTGTRRLGLWLGSVRPLRETPRTLAQQSCSVLRS